MSAILDEPALVLNRGWTPIQVTTVRHAIVLGFGGRARYVDPDDFSTWSFEDWVARRPSSGRSIQGVGMVMPLPEVIVLEQYARLPPMGVVFNRRNLHRRDGGLCQYCGENLSLDEMTIDHVHPISRGGTTDWDNCVVACRDCNGRKADRLPQEVNLEPPRPRGRPGWSPLFSSLRQRSRPKSWEPFLRAARAG